MTAATLVLVHGPCGTPAVWSRLIPFLNDARVPSVAVHLPSSLPESDLDDGAFLQRVLDDIDDPAVLVGHSGAAFPMTQVGEHPSVRHLVYLDAPLPEVGETVRDQYEPGEMDETFVPGCIRVVPGGFAFDHDALAAHLEGRGWPRQEARELASEGCAPTRVAAQVLAVTVASWRTVPSTYIGYAESQARSQARARFAARAMHAVEIPGDHFALWQRPGELAEVLVPIARDAATP